MSNSRLEKFIYAICSMEVSDLPAPLSRIEILWNCLITGETPDFEPQSRNEQYLMAMLGLYELDQLPTPMSRGEKLLYKIAMGETNLSDIPAYLSRYEELLGYLAENGGVGDFEYILQTLNQRLSTLYSTKERPMKQAVIKGDTLVNELPRPSLKNTMTNVRMQKLNHGYDNGKTLVNLLSQKSGSFNGTRFLRIPLSQSLKTNTDYLVKFNIKESTLTDGIVCRFKKSSNSATIGYLTSQGIITTTDEGYDIVEFFINNTDDVTNGLDAVIDDIMLIEYQDGMENWDIPYFEGTKIFSATPNVVDGEFKQAVAKGQTLVNLFNGDAIANGSATNTSSIAGFDKNTNIVHFITNLNYSSPYNYSYLSVYNGDINGIARYLKNDTDYTILWYLEKILDADDSKTTITIGASGSQYGSPTVYNKSVNIKDGKMLYHTQTTYGSDILRLLGIKIMNLSNDIEYKGKFVIIEGDYTNIDIPYFEGMQSVQLSEVTTTGKNLFDINKKIEGYIVNGSTEENLSSMGNVWTTPWIKAEPNTDYVISGGNRNRWQQKSSSGVITFKDNPMITTASDTEYIRCYYCNETYTATNVQLEQGSVATPYEPYQSNTLTLAEPVTLRKVGDVEDEFDALTGQVTERVGEVVLDGSENWNINYQGNSDLITFVLNLFPTNIAEHGFNDCKNFLISDSLPIVTDYQNNKGILSHRLGGNHWIVITVNRSDLISEDVVGFKHFLSTNPVTIQYQLLMGAVKTVDLTITNQDGAIQTKLHSFNDGHLSVSSQGVLPSAVNYEVPTNNSYYLPDMLTLGAQYTARGSADCNATIDGKLLALGKNRTFTTPSSLTNRLMVLDAPVDDLMFIKGDQTAKDFGYFEGMKSVVLSNKMPVLTTTGKNLFDKSKVIDNKYQNCNVPTQNFNITYNNNYMITDYIKVSPNTTYTKTNFNRYAAYYDINKEPIKTTSINSDTFTTPSNANYIVLNIEKNINDYENAQLELGSIATSYEPFKSNILSTPEDLELRGIGDVQDTLDCLTGEVTERIGEIVLDGSETWTLNSDENMTYNEYYTRLSSQINPLIPNNGITNSDFMVASSGWKKRVALLKGAIYITIEKNNASSIEELKSYLQSNPIIVQYQLATESVKTVDLTTVDQDGQPTKLKTFNDITHVEIKADNLIPSIDVEVATKISETLATLDPQQLNISNTQNKLGQTIDEQAENTDATMMATTEIYEQTL